MAKTNDELDKEIAVNKAEFESFMRETRDYRNALCAKFDRVEKKLDSHLDKMQEVQVHSHRLNSHGTQIKAIWITIFAGVCYFAKKAFGVE